MPIFVRQLSVIEATDSVVRTAVSDFLRAHSDKVSWADDGEIVESSLEETRYFPSQDHALTQEEADVDRHLDALTRGRQLYRRCIELQTPLEGRALPSYFISGEFNWLADECRLAGIPIIRRCFRRHTMSSPSSIALVQNPALGALLLWKFGKAYQEESVGQTAQAPSFFLILPLLYHAVYAQPHHTQYQSSGLAQVAKKLGDERELIIAFTAGDEMRDLTLASIATGINIDTAASGLQEGSHPATTPVRRKVQSA